MLAVLTFMGFLAVVTGLIHLYLWKRLVRDTTGPGRRRSGCRQQRISNRAGRRHPDERWHG